jgi:hypothetical protein
MSIHNAVDFEAFWEAGGPWPPLALSALVGVVTLVVGLMLVYHGTSMSSSPLILCSVAGLLIGLSLTVILPQAMERLMTVMPSERIFMIFLLAPLLMYIWEHVVLDHQHIHPLADGSTAGCSDVGCEDGCGGLPVAPPEDSTPGSGWAFKPRKVKPGEKSNLLDKVRNAPSWAEVKARRYMPRGVQPPGWLMWLLEKWAVLMRLGAPAVLYSSGTRAAALT